MTSHSTAPERIADETSLGDPRDRAPRGRGTVSHSHDRASGTVSHGQAQSPVEQMAPDLQLLDDETPHAFCPICHPVYEPGRPFTALCGQKAVGSGDESDEPPSNACPDCLVLVGEPCRRCGT
jgi:hypothetical protein